MEGEDITGRRFGRLVVLGRSIVQKRHKRWDCRCDCGGTAAVQIDNLRSGHSVSCGCSRVRHGHARGHSQSTTHAIWAAMKQRCLNPSDRSYFRYGGRGIGICQSWMQFANFLRDMGERPAGMTLERIDNNRGYGPANCRWATRFEQMRNMRRNRILEIDGRRLCLTEWAEEFGIDRKIVDSRLRPGWDVLRALAQPKAVRNAQARRC